MQTALSADTNQSSRNLFLQIIIVTFSVVAYFLVRGLTDDRSATAISNATKIIEFEESVGLDFVSWLQRHTLDNDVLITAANWVYIWGHWPVIIAALFWLYKNHHNHYIILRNAMLVSGVISLLIFAVFPVTPPRLMTGFVDTVAEQSNSYRLLQPPTLVNKHAAMPSFHFGWNLLVSMIVYQVVQHRWLKVLVVLSPIAMLLAIMITANHYFLDAVVGGGVVLISYYLVTYFGRARQNR